MADASVMTSKVSDTNSSLVVRWQHSGGDKILKERKKGIFYCL
jgi:hypothetical protein